MLTRSPRLYALVVAVSVLASCRAEALEYCRIQEDGVWEAVGVCFDVNVEDQLLDQLHAIGLRAQPGDGSCGVFEIRVHPEDAAKATAYLIEARRNRTRYFLTLQEFTRDRVTTAHFRIALEAGIDAINRRHFEEAEAHLDVALLLSSSNPDAFVARAQAREHLLDIAGARADYGEALRLLDTASTRAAAARDALDRLRGK